MTHPRAAGTTVLLSAAHFANDALLGVLPALLPLIAQRFVLTGAQLALFVATFAVASSLPQPLFGRWSDRIGGRSVATIGLLGPALMVALLGVVPNPTALLALLIMGGLGSAALHPAGIGMTRLLPADRQRTGLTLFMSGGMLGSAVGPPIALALVGAFGLPAAGWMMMPGVLMAWLLRRHAPTAPHERPSHERQSHTHVRPLPRVRDTLDLLRGPVGALTVAGALALVPLLAFTNGLPLWLVRVRGIAPDAAMIGWTLSTFSASAAIGSFVAGAAARRWSASHIMVGTLLFANVALQGVLLVTPGSAVYFALVALVGASLLAHMPLLVHAVQERAPGQEAAASGLAVGITLALAGVLYAMLGALQPHLGLGTTLSVAFTAVTPAALVAGVVLRHCRQKARRGAHELAAPRWRSGTGTPPAELLARSPCS